jgi:cyclase
MYCSIVERYQITKTFMLYYKRIIYCLYFKDNFFYLSRNFRLQKVGDLNWLIKNFGFGSTTNYIDELMIVLVKKNPTNDDFNNYFKNVENLRKNIFIPIVLGGGINHLNIAKKFFENGADKISINTACYENKDSINEIADIYGSQAISIMLDYKKTDNKVELYSDCGTKFQEINFAKHLKDMENLNCGEIILNSIDNDGNGAGLDIEILKYIKDDYSKPILLMGGAGKPEHFSNILKNIKVSGAITANLFNFLGSGLNTARKELIENKIDIVDFK